MAELNITKTVVTPTCRLAVEFTAAAPAPTQYRVTATGVDTVDTVTATGTGTIIVLGQLQHGKTYSVAVTADYTAPTPDETGAAVEVTMSPKTTREEILRQALADILTGTTITDRDNQTLQIYVDAYGQPVPRRKGKPIGAKGPLIAFGFPKFAGSETASGIRRQETFAVPVEIIMQANDDDDAEACLAYLYDQVRQAVDKTANLGISTIGVIDRSWTWKREPVITRIGDQVNILKDSLSVPFQVLIGRGPYGEL